MNTDEHQTAKAPRSSRSLFSSVRLEFQDVMRARLTKNSRVYRLSPQRCACDDFGEIGTGVYPKASPAAGLSPPFPKTLLLLFAVRLKKRPGFSMHVRGKRNTPRPSQFARSPGLCQPLLPREQEPGEIPFCGTG